MAQKTNSFERFWRELKRRKVINVITVYASAAFGIIEIVNNFTTPLHLPTSVSTIVIIVLAVGFPFAIILSWIYDLTGGSFVRTKPMDDTQAEEVKVKVPNAWKIATYISFMVIIGLVVMNIARGSSILKPGSIQSLVILPFDNETGDDKLEYFVSGMHSSLIADVGKIGSLHVISKTTSDVFKNAHKSLSQIASELKVDAVVEGQVMCLGDSICLQVRMVTADKKEKQLWSEGYSEDKRKILSLYNQVTKQIAHEVMVKLSPEEDRLLSKSRIVDRQVYEAYLNAKSWGTDVRKESLLKARDYLNSAIERDPDWAALYAGLADVWMSIQQGEYELPSITSPKIYENLNKALELDPDLSDAHSISGMMAYLIEWNWEKAEKELLKAIAINPNDVFSRIFYAHLLSILQRPDEALKQGQLAIRLDPSNPQIETFYSALLTSLGDCKSAMSFAEKVLAVDPENILANNAISSAAYQCKDYEKVLKADMISLHSYTGENAFKGIEKIYHDKGFTSAYEEIALQFEKFTLNKSELPFTKATLFFCANQPDKAIDWLEKACEVHDPIMPYIATHLYNFDPLFSNPRFIALIKKMNLPLPKN